MNPDDSYDDRRISAPLVACVTCGLEWYTTARIPVTGYVCPNCQDTHAAKAVKPSAAGHGLTCAARYCLNPECRNDNDGCAHVRLACECGYSAAKAPASSRPRSRDEPACGWLWK